ncbi:hypothetical protein C8R43DRAFT_953497 [Mycena crocata]|nr:hypothetical protein C8R43DRAFT_953497 [Mycena crocata]
MASAGFEPCQHLLVVPAKVLLSVVAMVPHEVELKTGETSVNYFLVEKPGLDLISLSGYQEKDEEDNTQNTTDTIEETMIPDETREHHHSCDRMEHIWNLNLVAFSWPQYSGSIQPTGSIQKSGTVINAKRWQPKSLSDAKRPKPSPVPLRYRTHQAQQNILQTADHNTLIYHDNATYVNAVVGRYSELAARYDTLQQAYMTLATSIPQVFHVIPNPLQIPIPASPSTAPVSILPVMQSDHPDIQYWHRSDFAESDLTEISESTNSKLRFLEHTNGSLFSKAEIKAVRKLACESFTTLLEEGRAPSSWSHASSKATNQFALIYWRNIPNLLSTEVYSQWTRHRKKKIEEAAAALKTRKRKSATDPTDAPSSSSSKHTKTSDGASSSSSECDEASGGPARSKSKEKRKEKRKKNKTSTDTQDEALTQISDDSMSNPQSAMTDARSRSTPISRSSSPSVNSAPINNNPVSTLQPQPSMTPMARSHSPQSSRSPSPTFMIPPPSVPNAETELNTPHQATDAAPIQQQNAQAWPSKPTQSIRVNNALQCWNVPCKNYCPGRQTESRCSSSFEKPDRFHSGTRIRSQNLFGREHMAKHKNNTQSEVKAVYEKADKQKYELEAKELKALIKGKQRVLQIYNPVVAKGLEEVSSSHPNIGVWSYYDARATAGIAACSRPPCRAGRPRLHPAFPLHTHWMVAVQLPRQEHSQEVILGRVKLSAVTEYTQISNKYAVLRLENSNLYPLAIVLVRICLPRVQATVFLTTRKFPSLSRTQGPIQCNATTDMTLERQQQQATPLHYIIDNMVSIARIPALFVAEGLSRARCFSHHKLWFRTAASEYSAPFAADLSEHRCTGTKEAAQQDTEYGIVSGFGVVGAGVRLTFMVFVCSVLNTTNF